MSSKPSWWSRLMRLLVRSKGAVRHTDQAIKRMESAMKNVESELKRHRSGGSKTGGKRAGNASLVGLLVAVAIVMVLVIIFLKPGSLLSSSAPGASKTSGVDVVHERKDKVGETIVGRSMAAAKDDVCREQLAGIRQSIEIHIDPTDDSKPHSLADLQLPKSYCECPIGHEPYVYDPNTGQVHCKHPGHEKY